MINGKTIMRQGTAFNKNKIIIEYSQFDLGNKYKVRYQKPEEFGFRFAASFATIGEANRYFDNMITGGRS